MLFSLFAVFNNEGSEPFREPKSDFPRGRSHVSIKSVSKVPGFTLLDTHSELR